MAGRFMSTRISGFRWRESGLLTAPNAVPQCHRADEHRRVVFQLIPGDSVTLVNRELRQRILDFAIGPIFRVPGTSIAQTFRTLN